MFHFVRLSSFFHLIFQCFLILCTCIVLVMKRIFCKPHCLLATRKYPRSQVYLPSSDIVASPSLATSPDCRTAPQHIKPYTPTSTSHSVVFPISPEVVGLVAHVADGSNKSETTPARQLLTSGDRPLDAVIMDERRDGPRWLCDDDDDVLYCRVPENESLLNSHMHTPRCFSVQSRLPSVCRCGADAVPACVNENTIFDSTQPTVTYLTSLTNACLNVRSSRYAMFDQMSLLVSAPSRKMSFLPRKCLVASQAESHSSR